MYPLETTFSIGSRSASCFKYIGLNIKQQVDKSIEVDQNSFAETIQCLEFNRKCPDSEALSESEKFNFRSIVGQLNWLSGVTRPDLAFDVCQLSAIAKQSTVADAKVLNKAVKKARSERVTITYPKLNLEKLKIQCYSDASYANLPNAGSQAGSLVLLSDGTRCAPLQWSSNKLSRVTRSTLAAETLALVSCCDSAIYLKKLVEAALGCPEGSTPIECIVDNKSLHESIHSVNPTSEQRLRVDIAALREMVIKKEITVIWKEKHHQLADCLTKKGASTQLLTETLQTGFLSTSQ